MLAYKHASLWTLMRTFAQRINNDSLLRNSIFMMSSTITTSAIGYLYWVIAAHLYSVHAIGLASAFISAMTLTSAFVSVGLGSALVQILPQREAGYARSLTLNISIATGISTSLLGGIAVAIALPYLSTQFAIVQYHVTFTFIFIVGVALCTIATLLDQTFIAERATSNLAIRNMVFALAKLAIMVLLVQVGTLGVFTSWVLALVATVILAGLVLLPRLKRGYRFAVRGIVGQIRPIFAAFAGHHFINIGSILPMYLLPVFVAIRLSATDNAYFYTTWMMGSIFFMISPSVATALFSEGAHEASDVTSKARKSILIICILLIPILLVFLLGGRYFMLMFGPSYPLHGLSLLMLLTVSAVPDAITNIYISLLRVKRRLRQAAFLNLSMAAIALTLAWILLPSIGIAGAGWAWLIAQSIGSLIVGADILISRNHVPVSIVAEGLQDNILLKRKRRVQAEVPGYITPKAISLIDTAVLPIVDFLSRAQRKKEEAISLIDTVELPLARVPSFSQTAGKETISLIGTSTLSKVSLPYSNQTKGEADRTTYPYPNRKFFNRVHNFRLIGEDEIRVRADSSSNDFSQA